ncbi:protein-L-isoaspartate(D-aspartate) O-methyltransferase [Conexibacter arvalis]|uniref:Protein-L-isoaspartate O-methyltransferase n=1 Tax=Conexibacter arvalis TaxID=912552 RepID=A0A840I7Q1_9ACTN|nr:protein-L-isoaspartate(D-aspartate) O-methyltransferase [Conexibacter arvalis]MBB4660919.1 protein-L-isoaspartate(D-aspartate) O-methyltransferase [Conexibacter arvalis]
MDEARKLARSLRPLVRDERVLEAVAAVPRHLFVPAGLRERAYENVPLPIGKGQTISQPLIVARMLELLALRPGDRVLDVGTGSGWHAALLAELASRVWTIERLPSLSRWAERNLRAAGFGPERVTVIAGDGSRGLPDEAPFDAINVAAAAWPAVPEPLERQLAPGGRLVAPVGASGQQLVLVERSAEGAALERTPLEAVRFVPLIEGEA